MNHRNLEEYHRRMQMFDANTRDNENSARILKAELMVNKLEIQNASLLENIQAAQQEIASLRDALANIIPQNQDLKRDIVSMKHLIQQYQTESGSQLAEKQRLIEQLSTQIATLNHQQEMRRSDLSSMGELTKSIEEKNRLEQEIQELKGQRLTDNENYEKMLVKKDEIIKGMNEQYSQVERVLSTKLTLIKSMEEEINYLKNELAQIKNQQGSASHELVNTRQENSQLTQQVYKLNATIAQMRGQLESRHQTSSSELAQIKHESALLRQELQQASRQCRQYESENQSLYNQNQEILKQYQAVKQENMQHKQELFTLKLQLESMQQKVQQLTEQNRYLLQCLQDTRKEQLTVSEIGHNVTNVSREIQLKQQYVEMLQQSRKQLSHNQVELKNTFAQLQGKISQLKIKDNEIAQLKLSISNYQHYQTYFQNSNNQLQHDKTNLLNKLGQKDSQIRSYQNRLEQLGKQISKLRKKIQQAETLNQQLVEQNHKLLKQPTPPQQKNSPIEHFYDCNNQKQLLSEQLKNTKRSLQQQKQHSQSYLTQIHHLQQELQTVLRSNKAQKTSPSKSHDYQARIHQLNNQNRLLAERLNQRTLKLQEKSKKIQKIQSQVKAQYENRIKSLQQQIYKLTRQNQQPIQQTKPSAIPELQKTDNFLIDDLDNEFQLQVEKDSLPQQAIQRQLHSYDKLNSESSKKLVSTDELPKSKQSLNSETDRPYKVMYEELRVQNDSLQAHLERLSFTLAETKENLVTKQNELKRLQQQAIPSHQTEQQLRRIRQFQRELTQTRQQLQRYNSLKQLLKLQKSQSKQKSSIIKQLQQKLQKLQKSHKELKQDYHNLQTLNEQTNEKYKKTLEQFKRQMNHMNDEILRQKNNIDDKKKEIKRLQSQYIGKINHYEDDNMALRSKIKKLQLNNTKLQQKIKQLEEEHIQKVIITRTQLVNYKQTQKRLEQLDEQIHSLLKDKEKFINQKKSLQLYYTEQISLLKNNFSNQRQKLLRKITELEQIKTQLTLKLDKTKEILQGKRKQTFQIDQNLQKTNQDNYHIKLQLSSALTQINTQLIKNKALTSKIQELQNQLNDFKMSYEGLVVEKSKNQRQKVTKNGSRVELETAYKQIQKLNDLLMDKEKQINYFLTHYPTNDKQKQDPFYAQKDHYAAGLHDESQKQFVPHYDVNRPRKASRQYSYPFDNPFTKPQYSESHYKSSKNVYPKQADFVKETTNQSYRGTYDPRTSTTQNPQGYYQKKNSYQQFNQPNQKFIGGFPSKYCTFAPEYHKI